MQVCITWHSSVIQQVLDTRTGSCPTLGHGWPLPTTLHPLDWALVCLLYRDSHNLCLSQVVRRCLAQDVSATAVGIRLQTATVDSLRT